MIRYIIGDSLQEIPKIEEEIHLVMTSPPYKLGKQYGTTEGQLEGDFISSYEDYEEFFEKIKRVFLECDKKLQDGRFMAINCIDITTIARKFGKSILIPVGSHYIQFFLNELAYDLVGNYIWMKNTFSVKKPGPNTKVLGSFPYPLKGVMRLESEYILVFRKPGETIFDEEKRKESAIKNYWFFNQVWSDIATERQGGEHQAIFPVEIPRRIIRQYSVKGDMVLDPFLGSGTTMLACRELDRQCIGIEIEKRFEKIIKRKSLVDFPLVDEGF